MIAEVAMRRRSDVARTLRRRLRTFEARYEMPSDRLEAAVANGSQRETTEIAQWLITFAPISELRLVTPPLEVIPVAVST